MAEITQEMIIETIEKMTVLELSELVKAIEDKFGVSAAAPVGMMMAAPGAAAEEPAEEKTEFDVVLKEFDAKSKIKVLKAVRAVTSLGLKEAKELVESIPKAVKEGVSKEEAEKVKAEIEAAGGSVEIS